MSIWQKMHREKRKKEKNESKKKEDKGTIEVKSVTQMQKEKY
jgi:hypothetical protein